MRINSYSTHEVATLKWEFPEVHFTNLNLLVGVSAAGKTRLLNTIFNLGKFAVNKNQFYCGYWNINVTIGDASYIWELETESDKMEIKFEKLLRIKKGKEDQIVIRNGFCCK
jgi:hypothetical protein